jgi:hypothetical protein
LEEIQSVTTTPMDWSEVAGPGGVASVRVQNGDSRLTIYPAVFRVTPDVSVRRKNLTFDVPVSFDEADIDETAAASVTLRPAEVSVIVSWPLSLPEPAPGGDGGLRATVTFDPATLERRKSMRLDVETFGPNQVEIVRVNPARILAVWAPPPPAPAPEAPPAPQPPPAPGAAPDEAAAAPEANEPPQVAPAAGEGSGSPAESQGDNGQSDAEED